MATLNSIPAELKLNTFSFLRGETSSLAALCLVSRAISKVATEVLYKDIEINRRYQTIYYLVCTFLDSPHLANRVRSIICSLYYIDANEGAWYSCGNMNTSGLIGAVLLRLAQELPRHPQIVGHIAREISRGNYTGLGAVLLLLLKNLKLLGLCLYSSQYAEYINDNILNDFYGQNLDRHTKNELRPLSTSLDKIQCLTIPIIHFQILSFFDFSNLGTLELNLTNRETDDDIISDPLPPISSTHGISKLLVQSDPMVLQTSMSAANYRPFILPRIIDALQVVNGPDTPRHALRASELRLNGLKSCRAMQISLISC